MSSLVLGLLDGLLIGLLAVGLVLIFRASRFLNLAHGQIGALPALLLAKAVLDRGWAYWVAFPLAVLVGAGTGWLVEHFLVARLARKTTSAVSLLLLTLGVTQLLLAVSLVPGLTPNPLHLVESGYPVPLHTHLRVLGVLLGGQYLLILVLCPALIAALAVFLRISLIGKMIRAAASNADAARTCGISPSVASGIAWALAGGLSAISAILASPSAGTFNAASLGGTQLFMALGAAAFGAFVSIPLALAGGLLLGVVNQLALRVTSSGGDADLVLFGVILLVVLARGGALGSAFAGRGAEIEDIPPVRVPAKVRDRFVVRRHLALLGGLSGLVGVVLPLAPGLTSEGHRFQLSVIVIYALVAVALTMLVGWGGQLSLGHFALVGLGAFVAARLGERGYSLTGELVICGVIGAAVMAVIGLPALRVRGLTLAVTTLGFAVVAQEYLFRQHWLTNSVTPNIDVLPPPLLPGLARPTSQLPVYYAALATLALTALLLGALRTSTPGRRMIAVRDNERNSAAFAMTPAAVKLMTLAVSGFVAGSAGVLWAAAWGSVSPDQFTPELSLAILSLPVIGGLGSVGGAIAAAFLLYGPTFFLSPYLTGLFGRLGAQVGFQLALSGLGLVGVLLSYPKGVSGAARALWASLLDRMNRQVEQAPQGTGKLLEVSDVVLSFGGVRALNGASLSVARGEIVGLIGANGAGKSTLVDVISGVLRPQHGQVLLDGRDVTRLPSELRAAVGLSRSFQAASLFPGLSVHEMVTTVIGSRSQIGLLGSMTRAPWTRRAERANAESADALIERLGLQEWRDTLTGDLSTGTRRICELALQLAFRPRLVLLDEPTAGVAQREAEAFGPLLRRIRDELDCAIVIVEHDMPLLMGLCDRVVALERGEVIAVGTPRDVRADPRVVASYLGTHDEAIDRSGKPVRPRRRVRAGVS